MKKLKILIFLFLTIYTINSYSQISINAKIGGGISGMNINIPDGAIFHQKGIKIIPDLMLLSGIETNIKFNDEYSLSADLNFEILKFTNEFIERGNGYKHNNTKMTLYCLAVPIYMKKQFSGGRFGILYGFNNTFLISSKIEKNPYPDYQPNPIKKYTVGVLAGFYCKLSKKTEISLIAKHDITIISDGLYDNDQTIPYNYYKYSITLNLSYKIFESKKK